MGLKGLKPKDPAAAEIALALASVADVDGDIMSNGLNAIGHDRNRIDVASDCSHLFQTADLLPVD